MARRRFRPHHQVVLFGLLALTLAAPTPRAQEDQQDTTAETPDENWPVEVKTSQATIVIYQPQVETFEDNKLTGRAAVSIKVESQEAPVFGAVWLETRVHTDRDTRMVEILETKVKRMRFAEATEEQQKQLTTVIEQSLTDLDISLSLDRLLAGLDLAERKSAAAKDLKWEPPEIAFVYEPAVLVTFDGEPELQKVEGSELMRVVNSPFTIALDMQTKSYYLDGGEIWYRAADAKGPWSEVETVPMAVARLRTDRPEPEDGAEEPAEEKDPRTPKIVVATKPTELVVVDGTAKYTPIEGSDLLYISNTDSDVLMDIQTQRHFLLISGRWYAAKTTAGPWKYVHSDTLPDAFAKIPADSDKAYLRTFIAGTDEANEAVLDAQVPQTAAIKRSEAELSVSYDGDPKFEKIETTSLEYAVNTSEAVIKYGSRYYCCHEAVWYVAESPAGPWAVADEIPKEIYAIPPSCPIYNVKYVYIYDATPEVVYVGYTSGYVCSYVYGGTIVYGTGYWYRPWYRYYYYPRPCTWGFHVRWNPWTGWGCGFSFSNGRFTIGVGTGGWWGPGGYNRYWRGYRHGYHHGYNRGFRAGYAAGRRHSNIYNRPRNRPRNVARAQPLNRPNRPTARPSEGYRNNVYADRNGNVHRRTENGWERRDGNRWSSERPQQRPEQRPQQQPRTSQSPNYGTSAGNLNRDYHSRQRGAQRTNNYRRSYGGGAGRGGMRGGGRRR